MQKQNEFNLNERISGYDPITQIVVRGDIKEFTKIIQSYLEPDGIIRIPEERFDRLIGNETDIETKKQIELKTEIEHLMRFCKNNPEARDRLNKISSLIEESKEEYKQEVENIIEKYDKINNKLDNKSEDVEICLRLIKIELIGIEELKCQ